MRWMIGAVVGLSFGLMATGVFAQGGKGPNWGFAYKFEAVNNDDGLNKDAETDQKTTTFRNQEVRIVAKGEMAPKVTYQVELNPVNTGTVNKGVLDNVEVTYAGGDNWYFMVGNPKVLLYGWRQKVMGPLGIAPTAMDVNKPMDRAEGVQFGYTSFGTFRVNAQTDYMNCPTDPMTNTVTCTSWNQTENSAAFSGEWEGNFGTYKPVVQYLSYDLNHSKSYAIGLRYVRPVIDFMVDYIVDERAAKGLKAPGEYEDQVDKITGINLEVVGTYGKYHPYAQYSTYNNEEYTAAGVEESTTNSAGQFDDNWQRMALGMIVNRWGGGFQPYAVYIRDSGKFKDKNNSDATFTESTFKLGIRGAW